MSNTGTEDITEPTATGNGIATEVTAIAPKKITRPYFEEFKEKNRMAVVVNGKVYDLTDFYETHPGGP
jgi:cytochrome b involved in lipid metabolism